MQSDDSLATLKDQKRRSHASSSSSSPSPINSYLHVNNGNALNGSTTTLLTPVSELTARLRGPFALRDEGDEVDGDVEKPSRRSPVNHTDAVDDDKENSNDIAANNSSSKNQPGSTVGAKKAKLESPIDCDLTPTASARSVPYVSEAELDALLDNINADVNAVTTTTSSFVGVDDILAELTDYSSASKGIEVTDGELDALLTDAGDGLLDSGHSSGGEVSSLLDSIDDIPSASVEIPSISDSTFSEDIPNLQQLPIDELRGSGGMGGGRAAQPPHPPQEQQLQHPQHPQHCPPSGARPKVRPASLGLSPSSLPVVSCDSGAHGADEAPGSMTAFLSAGALEDITPTNHLPASGHFDPSPPADDIVSSPGPVDVDNHLSSLSSSSSQYENGNAVVTSGNHVNNVISGTNSTNQLGSSSNSARHLSQLSSSASLSPAHAAVAAAPPHSSLSSPLSSFTTQSYPNIATSVCNNAIEHPPVTTDDIDGFISHKPLSHDVLTSHYDNHLVESLASTPSSSIAHISESYTRLTQPVTALSRSSTANEGTALTPDTPDTDEELDQSSSSIRHVTSPPTPFVKGGLLDDDDDDGEIQDHDDTLPTPTSTSEVLHADDGSPEESERCSAPPLSDIAADEEMPSKASSPVEAQSSSAPVMPCSATAEIDSGDVTMKSDVTPVAVQQEATAIIDEDDEPVVLRKKRQPVEAMEAAASSSTMAAADASSLSSSSSFSDSVRHLEPSRPSAKRPSSLDLPSRSPFAFKPQKRHHKGVDDPSPSLDSVGDASGYWFSS